MQKNHLITLLLLALSFSSIYSKAQTDFRPGYIISNEHDTIIGYIDYRGNIRNCKVCVFKQTPDSPAIEYSPSDIIAYRFSGSKYYVSKMIEIDSKPQAIFAEYLVDGIVDLLFYSNNYQSYYLIEPEGQQPVLLESKEKKIRMEDEGSDYVYDYKKYIGVLKAVFSRHPELFKDIDHAQLTHKSLASITKKYHDYVCEDDQCIVYLKEVPVVSFNIAVTGNMEFPNISVSEGSYYSENYQANVSPAIGISTDIFLPQQNEKLAFNFSLTFGKYLFQATDKSDIYYNAKLLQTLTIEAYPLELVGGLKYTFPKRLLRPTFFLGVGARQLLNLKNTQRIEGVYNNVVNTKLYEEQVINNFLSGIVASIGSDIVLKSGHRGLFKIEYKYFKRRKISPEINISSLNFCIGYYL